jgi:hypothetical protein
MYNFTREDIDLEAIRGRIAGMTEGVIRSDQSPGGIDGGEVV